MKLTIALALALVVVAPAVPVLAQDGPAGSGAETGKGPGDPVRAWSDLQSVQAEIHAARQARDTAKVKELQAKETAAEKAFAAAFAAADWSRFDPVKDREILGQGLLLVGGDALSGGDAKTALRAFETYLEKLPKGDSAAFVEGIQFPAACIAAGDVQRALPFLEKHSQSLIPHVQAGALVLLGDVRAALEGPEPARKEWSQVAGILLPSSGRDVYKRAKTDANIRLALVGRPAPEIDSRQWVGATARPLSATRGNVVLLDFWATWCMPCRKSLRRLDALHEAKKKDGLVVLGVTRFFSYGFLPVSGADDPVTQGERVGDMTESDFPEHLHQFKTNLGLGYPFVTAAGADFKAYSVEEVPTTVLIDRQGTVAFVKVGGSDELLRLTIDRLLKESTPVSPK